MDAILDTIWEYIADGFIFLGESFYQLLENFHFLGPATLVFILALLTVCVTKTLNKLIITKRYIQLEKQFTYWVSVREEAMKCEDREKGKRMARNIDQAELNRAYYDYFFEGFLLGIARKIIPIFFMFAFINEFYKPEAMQELFGQKYVFRLSSGGESPLVVGAVFWYFISILICYCGWSFSGRFFKKNKQQNAENRKNSAEKSGNPGVTGQNHCI